MIAFYKNSNDVWVVGREISNREGDWKLSYHSNNTYAKVTNFKITIIDNPITEIVKNDQGDKYTSFTEFNNAVAPFFVNAPLEWGNIGGNIGDQLDLISINNLINYYLKTETYSQSEVDQIVANIKKVTLKLVEELPEEGETNIIYLVPKEEPNPNNVKDEYIWLEPQEEEEEGSWEHIGTTEIKFEWGAIEGDIEDQEDLKEALDEKADSSNVGRVIEVTVETAENIAAKIGTTVAGNYIPRKNDIIEVTFTLGTNVNNPTLSIDGGEEIPILVGGVSVTISGGARPLAVYNNGKIRVFYDGISFNLYGTNFNTIYALITETEIDEGVSTTLRTLNGQRAAYIINKAKQDTIDELLDDALNLADLDNYDPNKVFNIQLDNGEIALEEVI